MVGYFLLSFLSFCFFTVVFNISAIAQVSADQPSTPVVQQEEVVPTPTIYTAPPPTETLTPTILPTATPTQAPQPTIATTTDLETLFSKYSSQYGVSEDELKKIANCESGFNSASDTGTYAGMFQFSAVTWASIRGAMGADGNPDLRKSAEEAIKTAGFMLARGEQNAWPNCH